MLPTVSDVKFEKSDTDAPALWTEEAPSRRHFIGKGPSTGDLAPMARNAKKVALSVVVCTGAL